MKALPLAPAGCSLSPDGLVAQADRAEGFRPAVRSVERSGDGLRIEFAPEVDRDAVGALVATERECCSFLAIDYDESARTLDIRSEDARGPEVLARLAGFFERPAGRSRG